MPLRQGRNAIPLLDRSSRSILFYLAVLLAAVFFLPYAFPVASVASVSSVVGYNNHVAFLVFGIGSLLFATFVRNRLPGPDTNQTLSSPPLFAALSIGGFCCLAHLFPTARHVIGGEAAYGLNRLYKLASGRPYLGFEYAYGPVHLYLPVTLAHATHGSLVRGYYLWWLFQWLAGICMLWATVKLMDVPLKRRVAVFWFLFILQLPAIRDEGIAYTPARMIGPAFLTVVVAYLWKLYRRPALTVASAIVSVVLALLISPEQGIAVFLGLAAWFSLLVVTENAAGFTIVDLVSFIGAGAILTAVAWRLGEFETLRAFATGGWSFPLLPSPTNVIILTCYVAAACLGVRDLLDRNLHSMAVPLLLVGYALLPAAFGRCDIGHLMSATPALFLGVALIESRPALRRVWSPIAIGLVVVPVMGLWLGGMLDDNQRWREMVSFQNSNVVIGVPATLFKAPSFCPTVYRTLNIAQKPTESPERVCLESGYYYLTTNALTEHSVDVLIDEIHRTPARPLLLLDKPLGEQFGSTEVDVDRLRYLELSVWVPPPRNKPFSYQRLIDAIVRDYEPSPEPWAGFRVWYSKSLSSSERCISLSEPRSCQ